MDVKSDIYTNNTYLEGNVLQNMLIDGARFQIISFFICYSKIN